MQNLVFHFKATFEEAMAKLGQISEAESAAIPASGGWSKKQILGHLIDSAANNHQRFVRVQLGDNLIFPTYEQEKWVATQQYQTASWQNLVTLWHSYNQHLAHVVSQIPAEHLRKTLRIAEGPDITLAFLIEDYLSHLQQHHKQLFKS